MKAPGPSFQEHDVLHELKGYLPAQVPFGNIAPYTTLYAFRQDTFQEGMRKASEIFGYAVSLSLDEFRAHCQSGRIKKKILERTIIQNKGESHLTEWLDKAISKTYTHQDLPRIGTLRAFWKRQYRIDLDSLVHPTLLRILAGYLDQRVALWRFPVQHQPFLAAIREMERTSFTSFFRTERARNLLLYTKCEIGELLHLLVGDESLYTHYLFDQQFAHQGWSGLVSTIEDQPDPLPNARPISLRELILFELLLEIDALDFSFGDIWAPLGTKVRKKPRYLFAPIPETELSEVLLLWQEAFEWSQYDDLLANIPQPGAAGEVQEADQNSKPKARGQSRFMHSWMKALFGIPPQPTYPPAALCIMGTPALNQSFFSDRRASLHSFDYRADPTGRYLLAILQSAVQACAENEIQPRLLNPVTQPSEFMRALLVVEHFPDVVLETIKSAPDLYAWFVNEWGHLVVVHPETRVLSVFRNGEFTACPTPQNTLQSSTDSRREWESQSGADSFQAQTQGTLAPRKLTFV